MAKLEQINTGMPLKFYPAQMDLDGALMNILEVVPPVVLAPADASRFMNWVMSHWRMEFEKDLQCISQDAQGRPLLSTWVPLVTFRTRVCHGGRHMQEDETVALMERIRAETRPWRDCGVDLVDVSAYRNAGSVG